MVVSMASLNGALPCGQDWRGVVFWLAVMLDGLLLFVLGLVGAFGRL